MVEMDRAMLDSAVKTVIATGINKPVGLSQSPSETPDIDVGYVVLFQSPSPRPEGSYGDPEDCRYFDYQVKSVGRSHRMCAKISSMVQGVLTNRAAGSGFATPITVTGLTIMNRETISNGVIRRTGDNLFETDDIYRLAVC